MKPNGSPSASSFFADPCSSGSRAARCDSSHCFLSRNDREVGDSVCQGPAIPNIIQRMTPFHRAHVLVPGSNPLARARIVKNKIGLSVFKGEIACLIHAKAWNLRKDGS